MTDDPQTTARCQCVSCGECGGHGTVWFTFGHKQYLGNHRSDDLDEMEGCDECQGSGISLMCDGCEYAYEEEMDRD